jgi:hypothetical protein
MFVDMMEMLDTDSYDSGVPVYIVKIPGRADRGSTVGAYD